MTSRHRSRFILLIPLIFALPLYCYEKTLRRIVRNQSKMIQQPFSVNDNEHGNIVWKNMSSSQGKELYLPPGYTQVKTIKQRMQHPKISTLLSSVDTGRNTATYSKIKLPKNENINPYELRLSRNSFKNLTMLLQSTTEWNFAFLPPRKMNNSYHIGNNAGFYYQTQRPSGASKFFPALDDRELQSVEQKPNSKEKGIFIPANPEPTKENNSIVLKGMFIANTNDNYGRSISNMKNNIVHSIESEEKVDYLIEEASKEIGSTFKYNVTELPYSCSTIKRVHADINAQAKFSGLDLEPYWMQNRQFWDYVFNSRYESLMRTPSWPSLNVILMPSSHVDSIWKRGFEQYHNNSVSKILSNIVKKLQFYGNFTFTWNEVSHLSHWWRRTTQKSRSAFRKLLRSGRLEITTGGWVETEEATAHIYGLVHQLIEGHQWLKNHLNYLPKVGWSTNSVTHSPTIPYLLSAAGISKLVITNVHYSWEEYLAEFQYSDFIWLQDWDNDINVQTNLNHLLNKIGNDRYPKHAVLTHFLQFNADNFKGCGPDKEICTMNFDFTNTNKNIDVHTYNIKQKSEILLEQYSKTGTITPHNVLIAPLGGPYRYESQAEFDYQYNNYQRLADFINFNSEIYKANIEFGTPKDYFNIIFEKHKTYPTLKGDFLNFADIRSGNAAYWTGFFTSRPLLKILLRRLHSTLRTTEILLTFAINLNVLPQYNSTTLFELLVKARESVARLQDRHVVGGTLNVISLQYVYRNILSTAKDCWYIQEIVASLLTVKPENPTTYLKKFVFREGEFISSFKSINPGDQIYVFNSLGQERTEVVHLVTKQPNIRIIDYNKKEVTIQINPIWTYHSDNIIKISSRFFKISFAIVVPPMTFELYKIKETYDASTNAATVYCTNCILEDPDNPAAFHFTIQPLQPGDVQLESYKHRMIIDEVSGFLKTVVEKETNYEKHVVIDYGAFRSSDVNAGMFLFNTNATKPLHDVLSPYRFGMKTKITIIIAGLVTTEMTTIYGHLLQHTIKIFNLINSPLANAIYIESKVDYEVTPKNRELEMFLSLKTDISNGNHPEIYTDNNGFQYTARVLNISRRIESNIYPITNMAFIQDHKHRMTLITDHAQAVTALQEGLLVVMLDRRVLFNDGRGTNEGLADSSSTYHRHYLLLENFKDFENQHSKSSKLELKLPSFSAIYLANSVDNILDIFIVDRKSTNLSRYAFLPLIKMAFPCDVAVITFRVIVSRSLQQYAPNTALLVLHRQGATCRVDNSAFRNCNSEGSFVLEKSLRNMKAAFHTNLAGTDDGVPMSIINEDNFSTMELMTLKIFFKLF